MDCARPVRTEAVLLQHNQSHLRTVGAPAPGAKGGGCTGRRFVSARFAPGRCSYNKNQSHPRTVGAPAPGAKGDLNGTWIVVARFAPRRCSYSKTKPNPDP